jgi:hypothetical protein
MPCQNAIERMPAVLKIREKARKYHFLPRKSIFGLRKNSTLKPSKIYSTVAGAMIADPKAPEPLPAEAPTSATAGKTK